MFHFLINPSYLNKYPSSASVIHKYTRNYKIQYIVKNILDKSSASYKIKKDLVTTL